MYGFVTLPTNFTTLVSANASTIFSDLAPAGVLIAGIFLGLFLISKVIDWLRGDNVQSVEQNVQPVEQDE